MVNSHVRAVRLSNRLNRRPSALPYTKLSRMEGNMGLYFLWRRIGSATLFYLLSATKLGCRRDAGFGGHAEDGPDAAPAGYLVWRLSDPLLLVHRAP